MLLQDIVITDDIAYNTDKVYFSINKHISFSPDSSKDIYCEAILEKNLKWGYELKQDYNDIDFRIGNEWTATGMSSSLLYKAVDGSKKTFSFVTHSGTSDMSVEVRKVFTCYCALS